MEYEILQADTTEYLQALVRNKVAGGWEPIGGVATTRIHNLGQLVGGPSPFLFTQAMIKKPKMRVRFSDEEIESIVNGVDLVAVSDCDERG